VNEARIALLGVNHRSAPLALRERLALTDEGVPEALRVLANQADEAYVLSTCNRTELIVVARDADPAEILFAALADRRDVPRDALAGHTYLFFDDAAVRHLFRVACGLDSMVLGESQILGQVRDAYNLALSEQSIGRTLGRVLPLALEVGKRARTETSIGLGAVSPSSIAVQLARRALSNLEQCAVLVIGAGDAAQATARSLVDAGVGDILVANRSLARAEAVASAVGGTAVPYDDLSQALTRADIVISSTGAPSHIVSADDLRAVFRHREGRPLLCIDIAVPRDIDPEAVKVPGVVLYNVDDLDALSEANLHDRGREVAGVEEIVEEGMLEYRTWSLAQQVLPTIGALYQKAEAIRRTELERAMRRMPGLSAQDHDRLDVMTASIVRRILHGPVAALKARTGDPDAHDLAQFVQELFALPPEEFEAAGSAR
jgi:glutamyl-tRNA reductase